MTVRAFCKREYPTVHLNEHSGTFVYVANPPSYHGQERPKAKKNVINAKAASYGSYAARARERAPIEKGPPEEWYCPSLESNSCTRPDKNRVDSIAPGTAKRKEAHLSINRSSDL
jgi:hypothetical protein